MVEECSSFLRYREGHGIGVFREFRCTMNRAHGEIVVPF
jgi:hypothetical protein